MKEHKGQFKKGNPGGPGRPKGSNGVPKLVKQQGWDFISAIFDKLFVMTEEELLTYIQENRSKMSRAEKIFIDQSTDMKVLQSLLDRVVGLPTRIEIKADIAELPNRAFLFPNPKGVKEDGSN